MSPAVYILHGFAYDTDKWRPFVKILKTAGFMPILLRIPGLTAPLNRPWDIQDYVSWLDGQIDNSDGPAVLLGHSNGGRIALNYAACPRQKINKLVLIDSAGIPNRHPLVLLKRLIFGLAARIGKLFTRSETSRNWLYRLVREKDYRDANSVMQQTIKNLLHSDNNLDLSAVKVPVTIIWGEKDRITPLWMGKKLKTKLKSSTLNIIKNAHHAPFATHPRQVLDIIEKIIV
jgi:pimeloyl-ACP methyl ester carboxylesterase